ncbi:PAS domain S-box protein [Stutzerimonas nosocomialis]|uniref:PAS domain S-box protein n=1 Tax=Stutzerimonas nosocomialis TaxID=1056496 RepID=UPI001F4FB6A0|nr:PAS domain S-box protein [Stutzerimonas nosocomialis]
MTSKGAAPWPRSTSKMGERIRRHDWAATPLGAPANWPPSLRILLDTILDAPLPMCILWGADGIQLYNDAHARLIGNRDRQDLGTPACQGWGDTWSVLEPACDRARRGEPRLIRSQYLQIERGEDRHDAWFDLSLSPIRGEPDDAVDGLLLCIIETTDQMRTEARLAEAAFGYKLSAEAHRQNEQRLQTALEASDLVGIWDWTLGADASVADMTLSRFLPPHMSDAERNLPLEDFFLHVHPEERARVQAALEQSIRETGSFAEYYRLAADGGKTRWAFARGRVHYDEQNRPVRFPGAVMDITRQQASEEALRKSEAELKLITDALPILIGYIDENERYRFNNRAYQEWYGHTPEWLAGKTVRQVLEDRDYESRRQHIRTALSGSPVTFEAYTPHQDGQQRRALVQYLPRRDAGGAVHGFYVLALDVTERWNTERALRESEQHLRATIDLSPAMHWSLDAEGNFIFLSDRWLQQLGVPEDEALGRFWVDLVRARHPQALRNIWQDAQRSGLPFDIEHCLQVVGGDFHWMRLRALPLHDADGQVIRWHGTAEDIHDRRTAEQSLRELNENLESRIQERTRALAEVYERLLAEMSKREQAQEALRQAQKMEAVGQLTGGIAHDFNNMLTGIIGGLDLVQHYIATGRHGETRRFIDAAITSANRASALTHRLLAFSRRQPLNLKQVELNGLILSIRDLLSRTLGAHIQIVSDLQEGLWRVDSDENQLESALLNLVINARDAMPDGGILRIATRNVEVTEDRPLAELLPGQYVTLTVSDTGCGMPPKVLASAFEPFFTTKPIGQGTGLGLSMIYGFVRQSGGSVQLTSEVGSGTQVCIYLPASLKPDEAVEPERSWQDALPASEGETVLVVEDDAAVRMLVIDALGEMGYATLEAAEGNTAIELLSSPARIDLLLTDVGLPGMNGRQLADIARQHRPQLRVLFMTGYAEQAASSGFLEPGMDLITKPFTIDKLILRIQEALH